MDRIIEVKVFGNHLTKDSNRAGVRGEVNTANLRITFDESWDDYAKEAIFWDAYGQNPTIIILTENLLEDKTTSIKTYLVPIPKEAMARAGMLTFVIKGITVQESKAEATEPRSEEPLIGKIQVSVTGRLEVEDSPDMLSPVNPTADRWNQMQSQYNEILGDLQAVATEMGKLPDFKENLEANVEKQAGIATEQAGIATEQAGIATEQAGIAAVKADEASESRTYAETARKETTEEKEKAKEYAEAAANSAEAANETANMVDLNVGVLREELSDTEAELEAHKDSFDHPDKSITTNKLADGAVTGDKMADETISESKLNEDVIGLIASNKFDGYISTIADADGIDNRDNPHNVRIFRVGNDNGKGEGGILIVSGDTNTLYEHHPLEAVEQTYITHDGYVKTRHATNWDGYDGLVFEWSEWESRYLTSEDMQELKAKTGYFSTSLAAGNVDYEIIAYDMTGIFGGLPVEPLTVVVSPENVGVWESLSVVYTHINGVRCKLKREDFSGGTSTPNEINGYIGDKQDWLVYSYFGTDYNFSSEEFFGKYYDISMAVPKFKVDEYGNISASSLKLKYDDRAVQIVNTAEGESIAMSDSADAQLRGLKVMGKTEQVKTNGYQLFNASIIDDTISQDGATVTNNGDGSFTIKGDGNSASGFYYEKSIDRQTLLKLFKVGKLTFNVGAKTVPRFTFALWNESDVQLLVLSNASSESASGTITQDILDNAYSAVIYISGEGDSTVTSCTFKPMLYQDGDGTWEPYTGGVPAPNVNYPQPLKSVGDDGSVDVHITSGNLMTDWIVGSAGASTGAITTDSMARRTDYIPVLPALGSLVASNFNGKLNSYMSFYDKDKVYISRTGSTPVTKYYKTSMPTNAAYVILNMLQTPASTGTIEADVPDVMLEYGTTPTAYKPYKPIQTLTISTPNGLPAVPVSSNGNYTDASGQQWACDEVDYNRGVYIKRVEEYCYKSGDAIPYIATARIIDGYDVFHFNLYIKGLNGNRGTTSVKSNALMSFDARFNPYSVSVQPNVEYVYLSVKASDFGIAYGDGKTTDELREVARNWLASTFKDDNPLIIKYLLLEPTETPLSAEEIAAYKALHTHYPSTSIHNSENAHMAVDYVADTKNYVDNKIKKEVAELKALVLEV